MSRRWPRFAAGAFVLYTIAVASGAEPPPAFHACQACHSLVAGENGLGPSLHGVYGRQAGQVPGFRYSNAMRRGTLRWDRATLTEFMRDPQQRLPGNRMTFAGMEDDKAIGEIVDYLAAAGAAPAAVPATAP